MNIKDELTKQLEEVNIELEMTGYTEKRAMLQVAKSNILIALQKYEK